ncbi:MAG: histone deacetylase family protein [Halodesulfurarchaeum sp.]
MKFGVNETCLEHNPGDRHPENPDRIRAIRKALEGANGVDFSHPQPATGDDARSVHDETYVEEIETFSKDGGGNWDADTVATERTWDAALASAGIAKWVTAAAHEVTVGHETPFSLGRPPGHHATPDDAMGFCFLNNAAIAAQHAMDDLGLDTVAILDWDVHHGNGTQDIFYSRNDVFYVSVHEHGLYPGTGASDEIGDGTGSGFTLNVPLPPASGDRGYLWTFEEAVIPAVREFDPALLLVSAGFDAHLNDPISRMRLSTEGFGVLTDRLVRFANETGTALGFVLEGGYGLDSLAESVAMVNDVIEGREVDDPDGTVDRAVFEVFEDVVRAHDDAWWG